MKVTPLELKKTDFKRGFRGFDPDEVQSFLASAAETLEELVRENLELKNQVSLFKERVKNYESLEKTLNETLIMAQKASESTRQASEREAELIIAKAEVQAERLLEDSRAELHAVKNEISALEREKAAFLVKMRSLVASQWKLLQEERFEEPGGGSEYAGGGAGSASAGPNQPEAGGSRLEETSGAAAGGASRDLADAESSSAPVNLSEQLGRILKSKREPLPGEEEEGGEALPESDNQAGEAGGKADLFWSEGEKKEKGRGEKPDVFWAEDEVEKDPSSGGKTTK